MATATGTWKKILVKANVIEGEIRAEEEKIREVVFEASEELEEIGFGKNDYEVAMLIGEEVKNGVEQIIDQDIKEFVEEASGLRYEDRVVGSGKPVGPGQDVSINYVGSDHKGDVFDRTYNSPYAFTLGKGQVIQGLDQGIEGMRVGGRRMLIIPADLAYGENPVVFDVQLMSASVNPGRSEDVLQNDEVEQLVADTVPKLMDSKSLSCRKAEDDSEESRDSANDKPLDRSSARKQRNYHYTFDVDDNGLDINGFIVHRNKKGHRRHKFRVYLDTNENGRFDRKDELIGKTGLKRQVSRKGIGSLLEPGEFGQLEIKFNKDRSHSSIREAQSGNVVGAEADGVGINSYAWKFLLPDGSAAAQVDTTNPVNLFNEGLYGPML